MKTMEAGTKRVSLLKELCGDDEPLYSLLANTLYQDPVRAVPEEDLDTLIDEAEKSEMYGFALDKAIFEGAQNPDERDKYISVIRDLVSKSLRALEKEKEAADKDGPDYIASSLGKKIERQKLLGERIEDVINVASGFYEEKLADLGAKSRHEDREKERIAAEREDRKINVQEKTDREARKKERKRMGRKERKEAKKQDQQKKVNAEEKKEDRETERMVAEKEEKKIVEQEKAERESRKEERTNE